MGCDIHLFVELNNNGKWKRYKKEFYIGRNYNLFAILANVRNGYGFARIPTGDGFEPIDVPRGLPKDVTNKVKKEALIWDTDGHNHSYLSLRELVEYDWGKTTRHYGLVDSKEYMEWKINGSPNTCYGSISGSLVKNITNKEMEEAIALGNTDNCWTEIEWKETYAKSVGSFFTKFIPTLKSLIVPEDLDAIRIVFWFDS